MQHERREEFWASPLVGILEKALGKK